MNRSTLRLVFAITVVGCTGYILATSSALPDPLASHFALDGRANNGMSRESYRWMMAGLALLIPLLMVFFQVWLPRRLIRFVNIPRRDYWLATEERKAAVIDYLERHALVTGLVPPLLFAGVHRLVIEANTHTPPQLDNGWFFVLLGGFVASMIAAGLALGLHFHRAN
jgi:hypothetical protein